MTDKTPDTPADPVTPLMAAGMGLHELFLAYMAGGFTESQALRLVAFGMDAAVRRLTDEGDSQQ